MDLKSLKSRLYSLFKCLIPRDNSPATPLLCDDSQHEEFERVYRRAQAVSQTYGQ